MAAVKLLNLFALVSVALVALSAGPISVNALAVGEGPHVARHVPGHDAVAKKRRDTSPTSTGRCKPRATSSMPSSTPNPTPAATPADLGVSTTSTTPAPVATTTSSSSSPAPSSTPSSGNSTSSSGKKWGLAWPNGDASYLSNFALPNVGFLYTWSPYLPSGLSELGIEGIPMLWGYDQVSDFQNLVVEGYANYVLGMNEPNEPSQSNMSPTDGASLWQQYIDPLQYKGYKLISPACTNDQAGLDWYQQFFAACSGCHFDAIAFHAYTTDAQSIIDYATTLYNTYNLPVWITEFADQNYSGTGGQASMDEVWSFASTITNFVANTDWLEVAFPFGVMYDLQGVNTDNSLLASNGYPTSLGYTYFG
ncbi:glycosyl hydrolase catalytic core-domain-containing protein [Pisolithus tinctorius]|nr:glycosyl hydrolase catalytic core-domain-containing protein [Pisolithus tinctorius]